jgi:hypothetical protein
VDAQGVESRSVADDWLWPPAARQAPLGELLVMVLLATHSLDVVLRCCDEPMLLDSGRFVNRWVTSDFPGAGGLAVLEQTLANAT